MIPARPRDVASATRRSGPGAWRWSASSPSSGRVDEARAEFERLAARDFEDVPLDAQWMAGDRPDSPRPARRSATPSAPQRLYEMLLPYDGLTRRRRPRRRPATGRSRCYLGRLALTLSRHGRRRRATSRRALELSRRGWATARSTPRPATTSPRRCSSAARRATASARSSCSAACSRPAQELGMRQLVERALALRLEAQGLAAVDVNDLDRHDDLGGRERAPRPRARHAAPDGTVTILFSDIENSTLMTERLGDERWIEVLRAHNAIFRERPARPRRLRGQEPGRRVHARLPRPAARRSSAPPRSSATSAEPRSRTASGSACGWACTPARRSARRATSSAAA